MQQIIDFRRFIALTERAESLIATGAKTGDWELVYDTVFGDEISNKIRAMDLSPSYCNPDTTYEEDVRAYVNALREDADRFQRFMDENAEPWEDDYMQFIRLLAEINAVGLKPDQMADLRASMDLDNESIRDILKRAEAAFEKMKP